MMVTVLIADDSPLMRHALTALVETQPDMRVVAVAGSADEAVALAETHRPDVAVLDVHMPGDGLTAAARIHSTAPGVGLIAFTGDVQAPPQSELDRMGLAEYLLKGATNDEIVAAIRRAAAPS